MATRKASTATTTKTKRPGRSAGAAEPSMPLAVEGSLTPPFAPEPPGGDNHHPLSVGDAAPSTSGMSSDDVARRLSQLQLRWSNSYRVQHRQDQLLLAELYRNRRWDASRLQDKAQGESLKRSEKKPAFMPNILQQAVKPLCYLYDGGARRNITPPGEGDDKVAVATAAGRAELWCDALWDFGSAGALDAAMGEIDRMVRLHGTVWVACEWHSSADAGADMLNAYREGFLRFTPGEDGVKLRPLPPYRFEVLPDPYDTKRVRAIVMWPWVDRFDHKWQPATFDTGSMQGVAGLYWDDACVAEVKGFSLASTPTPHGLGRIPGFAVRNEEPQDGFWSWGLGGEDCPRDILDIARMWREYTFTAKCSRGTYWTNGHLKAGSDSMGPDFILELEPLADGTLGSVGVLQSGANLDGMRATLMTMCEGWARACGIPAALVRIDEKTTQQSGRAIIMQSAELEDDRPNRVKIFQEVESEAMAIAGAMLATSRRDDSLRHDHMSLTVEHQEYVPKLTHADLLAQVRLELDLGLSSKLAALRDLHPGMSDDDLLARLPIEARDTPEAAPALAPAASLSTPPSPAQEMNDNARTDPPSKHPSDTSDSAAPSDDDTASD